MPEPADQELIERVDALLGSGFIGEEEAERVVAAVPETEQAVVGWLRQSAAAGDWRRFGRFANLAAPLTPPGLGAVIREVLASASGPVNREDLVEILGEIADVQAVPVLLRTLDTAWPKEAPYHSLSRKCVEALGAVGTQEAQEALRRIATDETYPSPVRWYAAVELEMEDELGFDEDEMLPGV